MHNAIFYKNTQVLHYLHLKKIIIFHNRKCDAVIMVNCCHKKLSCEKYEFQTFVTLTCGSQINFSWMSLNWAFLIFKDPTGYSLSL